ncbi:MAG: alpha/beta fold hydrolase [Dehalococcoidia bacterium]
MVDTGFDFRRYLNIRGASLPSFSPDGAHIAFVSDSTGVPQVWSIGIDGGWPEQVTFVPERVSQADYSPVADELLFNLDAGGNERHQLYLLSGNGETVRPIDEDPEVMHNLGFWSSDGRQISFASNRRRFASFDAYVADVAGGRVRRVMEEDGNLAAGRFAPDGKSLLVARVTSSANNDLFLVDLQTEQPRHLTPHEGQARYQDARFSADGKGLYLLSDQDREFLGLAYLDLGTLELRFLVEREWDIEGLSLSKDGGLLAYLVNVGGASELHLYRTADGEELSPPQTPRGVINGLSWSPDGRYLAYGLGAATLNPNCWLLDVQSGRSRMLTHASTAGLPAASFVEPALIHYPTFDGRQIPAFWYGPRTAGGEPLPVVINIHGGPEGQARPIFNPVTQYLVQRGYAVLAPNVRGSTGYGREYVHLDDVRLRMDTVKDIKHAVEWLKSSGRGDPRRIACMGGSYGGFMVLACVTTYPELWAAAVDIVGIANWMTMLKNTSAWRRRLRMAEYGDPELDGDFLREISPINHVDRITAPLMVIHGANDPRVPISEAEQIVGSLEQRGRPVTYLRFEDEGHGVVKLENRVTCYTAIAEFLDQYLTAGKRAASANVAT